ncbi:MAG: hypothetical protein IT355_04340 [Gemmatimonadaceae bacterium]|nr:hypothetical protein [Gemmatimonadaceae bacterium]
MHESSRFVFLINAAAGTGKAPRRLVSMLAAHPGVLARSRFLRTATTAALDAALRLADDEIPVAVGGDGSLNALVTLMDRRGELQRTLGLVPFGTGNATAHTLGLASPVVALRALEQGRTRSIDMMRTSIPHQPIALVSCSTGFESEFLQRYAALRYRSRQWAGWSALLLNLPTRISGVTLVVDGTEWVHPTSLVHNVGLYNIPHYAFGCVMWRGMEPDDGLAIAAEVSTPLRYWNLMARGVQAPDLARAGAPALPGVRTIRWKRAELRSPTPLQVDGEPMGVNVAELAVDSRALTVIAA